MIWSDILTNARRTLQNCLEWEKYTETPSLYKLLDKLYKQIPQGLTTACLRSSVGRTRDPDDENNHGG